jgi:hypothetical protein
MKSAIRDELVKTSKLTPKRDESEDAFLTRVHYAIAGAITDAEWEALSKDAQKWNNDAADAIDAKTALPAFIDAVDDTPAPAPAPAPATSRRRGAPAAGMEVFVPKVGAPVIVTTKGGMAVEGFIVELGSDYVVINPDGEDGDKSKDRDFDLPDATITPQAPKNASPNAPEPEPDIPEPEVGDTVSVTNSRDKVFVGNVIKLDVDKDILVIKDVAGTDHEFSIGRLKDFTVKVKGKSGAVPAPAAAPTPAPAPTPAAGRGRKAAAAPTPAADAAAGDDDGGRVTVSSVIRDTLVDNPKATQEDVEKNLTRLKVPFSPVTVRVSFRAVQSTVEAMVKKYGIKV